MLCSESGAAEARSPLPHAASLQPRLAARPPRPTLCPEVPSLSGKAHVPLYPVRRINWCSHRELDQTQVQFGFGGFFWQEEHEYCVKLP